MMGKLVKVFLLLLLLSSSSSYSQEIKVVRSLGFDGVDVERRDRSGMFACQVTRLHPSSLASQLGLQEGFVILWYSSQNLSSGCSDIDDFSKFWKDRGALEEIQVWNTQGNLRDIPITTVQFKMAQENLNPAQGSKAPSPNISSTPQTLTIFVDGIDKPSFIKLVGFRDLFVGPFQDRASSYLKGSPIANIFSDDEVKEALWNGDIADNVNVKKAVNDLEFILLKSSRECGKKINVVSHSLGTVISYLALLDLKFKIKN